ncbi:MAG: dynein regulation protein LC7 [Deltaproteobacteria bacterium]|nr:dynein regulation protein LC7 [Deltaproteobacteria bacterium]
MAGTTNILKTLNSAPGIHESLVVGRDGFVIDNVGDMDADGVGAVVSTAIGAIEAMGRDCEQGALFEVMAEYKEGVIIAAPIGRDAVLGVVADGEANLGAIRHAVKKNMRELEREL